MCWYFLASLCQMETLMEQVRCKCTLPFGCSADYCCVPAKHLAFSGAKGKWKYIYDDGVLCVCDGFCFILWVGAKSYVFHACVCGDRVLDIDCAVRYLRLSQGASGPFLTLLRLKSNFLEYASRHLIINCIECGQVSVTARRLPPLDQVVCQPAIAKPIA